MLLCTVRDCRAPLNQADRQWTCVRGHSFDIARSGYVNLLQPQDSKSKHPGDTPEAVTGRRRLHDAGVTGPLYDAIAAFSAATAEDVVLDAGCGEGFYPGTLAKRTGCRTHGVDISIPAIDQAARRYPTAKGGPQWVVANADRFVPYADGAFSLLLSITARMNSPEFRRVLHPFGRLLVAVPAPDDLKELRHEPPRDRVPRTVETFAEEFRLADQQRVTTTAMLDASMIEDLRHSIYRPMHATPHPEEEPEPVTFSLDLLLFRPK